MVYTYGDTCGGGICDGSCSVALGPIPCRTAGLCVRAPLPRVSRLGEAGTNSRVPALPPQQLSVFALQNPAAPHLTRLLSLGMPPTASLCAHLSLSLGFLSYNRLQRISALFHKNSVNP